ncbi:isoprenylcysteine carboxylmethyltransferase family protein [Kribbella sp. NPDC026611]|uniref:methyltransferase family protein n=1 Tax=Kribbella sp. NPDC026611 TaxID=3154911 RepID=UPI0033D1C7FF
MDLGRLVMVPGAVLMLCADAYLLTHSGAGSLRWFGNALVAVFYALIIWAYVRRGPAKATSTSLTAHVAAVVATLLPFAFPLLTKAGASTSRELVADILLVMGTAWSVWSLRTLGKNLSVIAQARDVVAHGPYRWVRHPLYTGEIISSLGLAIVAGTVPAAIAWLLLVTLQTYRARTEEQVLLATLPTYASYRSGTAALLPGLTRGRREGAALLGWSGRGLGIASRRQGGQ